MISVKDSLNNLDRQIKANEHSRRLAKKCMELWQESLRAVQEHVFPLFPEAARKAQDDWQRVHSCVHEDVTEDVLNSMPRLVEQVLHDYAVESRRAQRDELDSVKSILGVMAEAVGSTRTRTNAYSESMEEVCETFGRLAQTETLDELRQQLAREAVQVRENLAQMVRESELSSQAMEKDLHSFQAQLARAELAASTDPLTGLGNRRELERQLELRIGQSTHFCALLFDLDHFKSINDRFGHHCGDEALRQFAGVLHEQVRPGDVAARWGGDEFFLIFDCTMKDALRRSEQISAMLKRRYEMNWNGKKISLPIQASSGVVEHCAGETAATLFRRADEAMYAVKEKQRQKLPD
jgi:diguanylate cyclase